MLKDKDIKAIKGYMDKSENPLIFYDDDCDGLCSYLLFDDYLQRGRGVFVKALPILDTPFLRKVTEYNPDYVFILDMPIVSQEFIDELNVPIIWVDHHPLLKRKGVKYYNSMNYPGGDKDSCTSLCYQITKGKIWLAMVGSVADWRIPAFTKQFVKEYPGMFDVKIKDPGKGYYETEVGKLVRIFSFILKGNTSDVRKAVGVLRSIESPYEILNQESSKGKFIFKVSKGVENHYDDLLSRALKNINPKSKLINFTYVGKKYSFTSELSNEVMHKNPNKVTVIARETTSEMKISIRAPKLNLLPILAKASEGLNGRVGGHEHACGGNFIKEDYSVFIERLKKLI